MKKSNEQEIGCLVCKFCDRDEVDKHMGYCRRFPPKITFKQSQIFSNSTGELEETDPEIGSTWPQVYQEDWCGEFQPVTKP